jgi:hypothetical protein
MNRERDQVDEMVTRYEELAIAWDAAPNARRRNKLFDELQELEVVLRSQERGREGLERLLSHKNRGVRFLVASDCLAWDSAPAIAALEELASSHEKHALFAEITLKEYRGGRMRFDWHTAPEGPRSTTPEVGSSVELVSHHIGRHIGPVAQVFDELVSDIVHIDIHHVEPSIDRPYHTLVTSGMSDLAMSPPPEAADCVYAELVVLLPPEWKLSQDAFSDESWYWPLRQLKLLARLPHRHDTWLWFDHMVPNGDPPEPYAPSTQLCCALLLPPITLPREFTVLEAPDGRTITFLALIPVYREEREHALRTGVDALIDRLDSAGIRDVVDPQRPNVCRSKLGRWFSGRG